MAAETLLVERFGGTWSHEQALRLVGLGLEDSARIFQDAGVRMGVHDIVDHLTDDVMVQLVHARRAVPPRRAGAARRSARGGHQDRPRHDVDAPHGADRRRPHRLRGVRRGHRRRRLHAAEALPRPLPAGVRGARRRARATPSRSRTRPNGLRSAVASGAAVIGVPLMVSIAGAGAHAVWPTLEGRTAAGRRAVPCGARATPCRPRGSRGEAR